jgi:error-prone DNA polymerase
LASREQDGPFPSAQDLAQRVLSLNHKELTWLARIGAPSKIDAIGHRRDALWQVDRDGKMEGPLLRQSSEWLKEDSRTLPLQQMTTEGRLVPDYSGAGPTVGKHPMHSPGGIAKSGSSIRYPEVVFQIDPRQFDHEAGCRFRPEYGGL